MGDRAALFRAVVKRIDFVKSKLSNGSANGIQFHLGERPMDLSLLQTARFNDHTRRMECDDANQLICHGAGANNGCDGDGEWYSAEVSKILRISGIYAFQQLFHDHDLSDAVALAGLQLDVGQVGRDCAVCVARLAGVAFWFDAVEEPLNRKNGKWPKECA